MRVLVRAEPNALRSSISFSTSGMIHGALLALVVFGKAAGPPPKPRSLYDELIRPNEKRIVWYRLPDRLPDVRPVDPGAERGPLRAARKAAQRIVAGARDDARPPRLVWAPAPEVAAPRTMPLPNVLAVAPAPLVKAFTPPPAPAIAPKIPQLPAAEAPRLAAAAAGPVLAPLKKSFTPPPVKVTAAAALPEAQTVGAPGGVAPAGPALAPLKKSFTPPPVKITAVAKLPDAQAVGTPGGVAPAGPTLAPLKKSFTPPAPPRATVVAHTADLPAISGATQADVLQLAIIGLDPSKTREIPAPPPSQTAGFSAGPKPQPRGAATDREAAGIAAPGVTVRDGAAAPPSLIAAIRPMSRPLPTADGASAPPSAGPVRAPDPSLEGRTVYKVAIQMPNVTSYSGSWIVWFAERVNAAGGALRAPSPVRKVDPKYIASAAAEGVQGIVRLGALIRKDGHVEAVKLLRHLDDRLDRSAMDSLSRWEFEPALRDGAPVEVDAVFEIPFRLAPKPLK